MSKFSDLPYHLLEDYFSQSISQGERNDNISGPYHRYRKYTNGIVSYDDNDMVTSHLQGHRQSITVTGGYWTKLWIKVTNLEGEIPEYPGFVEFQFRVDNNYLEGDHFKFSKGSMLTVAASVNSKQFTNGSEVYFKRGTYLYEWLLKNVTEYRDYFNTNKTFCYFGKIYPHKGIPNAYHIIFDGMKNYVMNALPRENRTDNLTEFMKLYFDKSYQKIYNKMKDIPSLLDPKEIDIRFIEYMSKAYLMDMDINLNETALREWTENLVYLLKRKGTYSALWIIWKTFLKNTPNVLNISERWHNNPDVFIESPDADIPLGRFADIRHEMNYGIVPEGCSGHYWYDKILHAISPGVIFIQNTPSTVWYINHTMYTRDVFAQCYNIHGEREWPVSVQSISTGMVRVEFAEEIYGYAYLMRRGDFNHNQSIVDDSWTINHNLGQKEVLTQFKDTDRKKIMPSDVKLVDTIGTLATFGDAEKGKAHITSEITGENFVVVYKEIASSTWECTHDLGTLGAFVGPSNMGVFAQCFNENDYMLQPLSLTIIDQNNCTLKFTEAIAGYAIFKASELDKMILPEYNLDEMILSPHYKMEIDLSCEPLDDDDKYILDQETIERLKTNWDLMRPVSRYVHYHELISPITDFTGEYRPLYGPGYNAELYTKFCLSAGELQPDPISESIYFKQYVNKRIWKINHHLNSDDFIVQCYDSENNRIWPDKIKTIGMANIEIEFDHSVNGTASLIETQTISETPSSNNQYWPIGNLPEWEVNHTLGVLEVLNQFDDRSSRNKIVPSGVTLLDENNSLAVWNEQKIGRGYSLSSAVSYVHVELEPSDTWTINHNLSSNSVVAQFFDNDNNIITPESLTINNSDYCTGKLGFPQTGYCILREVNEKISEEDIMGLLQDYGHWELGNGTSKSDYDPMISNGVDSMLISGGIRDYETVSTSGGLTSYGYSADGDYYYLSNEVSDLQANLEDWEVTEIAWLTIIDGVRKVRFYSYFDPIYKPSDVWFNTHMRIARGQT